MTDDYPTLDNLDPLRFKAWTDFNAGVCGRCGSVVQSGDAHDRWHRAIEAAAGRRSTSSTHTLTLRANVADLADKIRAAAGTAPTPEAYQAATDALELRRVALVRILGLAPATGFHDAVDYVADLVGKVEEWRGKSERLRLDVASLTNGMNAMAEALHGVMGGDPDTPYVTLVERVRAQRAALQRANDLVEELRKQVETAVAQAERCRRDHAGLYRGEVERLRRVESALIELGAPGASTKDDPGGPMIAWIKRRMGGDASPANDARMEVGYEREALLLRREVEQHECPWSTDEVNARIDERRKAYVNLLRLAAAGRDAYAESMEPAVRTVLEHEARTFRNAAELLEDPTRISAHIPTRMLAEVDKYFTNDTTEPVDRGLTDQVLADLLSLVSVTVSPDQVATWTPEQREQAAEWASLVHLSASDNDDVKVPPRPAFLDTQHAEPVEPCKSQFAWPLTGTLHPCNLGQHEQPGKHGHRFPNGSVVRWTEGSSAAEPCPSLYLHDGALYACAATWEHDRHQNTPSGTGDVTWFESDAVPVPWPKDQEPPQGIDVLRDTSPKNPEPYLVRNEHDPAEWQWRTHPDKPNRNNPAAWSYMPNLAEGDLVVVQP